MHLKGTSIYSTLNILGYKWNHEYLPSYTARVTIPYVQNITLSFRWLCICATLPRIHSAGYFHQNMALNKVVDRNKINVLSGYSSLILEQKIKGFPKFMTDEINVIM